MNRLIIIGNGFDLACGFKTSYADFIENYWVSIKSNYHEDEFIKLNIEFNIGIDSIKSFKELQEAINDAYRNKLLFNINTYTKRDSDYAGNFYDEIIHIYYFKNKFFKKIIKSYELKNWVDIENEYFQSLKNCQNITEVQKLNEEFSQVKEKLKEYLITVNHKIKELDSFKFSSFKPLFQNPLAIEQQSTEKHSLYILNFNYTSTISKLLRNWGLQESINHIHGDLGEDNKNPIIFGYGDESTDEFKSLERKNENEYLKNYKSYKYLQTDNYQLLLDFISKPYEVAIIGHSCGLSDRVLLNTVLENENVKRIRLFQRKMKTIDDSRQTFENHIITLSRNFNNPVFFREKVLPFQEHSGFFIPQINQDN